MNEPLAIYLGAVSIGGAVVIITAIIACMRAIDNLRKCQDTFCIQQNQNSTRLFNLEVDHKSLENDVSGVDDMLEQTKVVVAHIDHRLDIIEAKKVAKRRKATKRKSNGKKSS